MKLFDVHTHIFSPELIKNRDTFLSDSAFSALYSDKKAKTADHNDLLREMDSSGAEYSVALGFSWRNEEFRKQENSYLAEVRNKSGGRILPFASPPSGGIESIDNFFSTLSTDVFSGIGEIAFYAGNPDLSYIDILLRHSGKAGIPVSLHISEPVGHRYPGKEAGPFSDVVDVIAANLDTRVILAHWGGGLLFYELMPEISRIMTNAYYDTAATPFLYNSRIYKAALELVPRNKILYGTDYPLLNNSRYTEDIIEQTGYEASEDILFNNSAALFGV